MKKRNLILSLLLCLALTASPVSVSAAAADDNILTLEEAKALALKNNVQYGMQQHYIDQAKEDYEEVLDDYSGNSANNRNIAAKAAAKISEDIAIENADLNVRKAVFNRDNMRRSSDYSVGEAFYNAIKAKQSLEEAKSDLEQKKTALETAKLKFSLSLIAQNSLFQSESSYAASQVNYSKAVSDLQVSFMKLSKSIGEELDPSSSVLDTAFNVPDPKNLDLNKIEEGYLQNNSSYFNTREQFKLAQYKLLLTEQEYEDNYDKIKNSSEAVREQFDDMLYDAGKSFDEAEYSYNQKLSDLDTSINNQYNSLLNLYDNYQNQCEQVEDERLSYGEDSIKYQMGLISKSALESSRASLSKVENQFNVTIMNLNLQYMNLTQYIIQ